MSVTNMETEINLQHGDVCDLPLELWGFTLGDAKYTHSNGMNEFHFSVYYNNSKIVTAVMFSDFLVEPTFQFVVELDADRKAIREGLDTFYANYKSSARGATKETTFSKCLEDENIVTGLRSVVGLLGVIKFACMRVKKSLIVGRLLGLNSYEKGALITWHGKGFTTPDSMKHLGADCLRFAMPRSSSTIATQLGYLITTRNVQMVVYISDPTSGTILGQDNFRW